MRLKALIFITLIISGCATTSSKNNNNDEDFTEGQQVSLPSVPKDVVSRSPFFNTQKNTINDKNGFSFDFYYGAGGRYVVVVIPPKNTYLDFSKAEGTLIVDSLGKSNSPEILSLAVEKNGIFSGIGSARNGKIDFKLSIEIPSSRYQDTFKSEINFNLDLKDDSF